MHLHWHRRDLRVADNCGLAAAAAGDPVVPVFVFDDRVLTHASPPRVSFMLDALASLRTAYRERGSDLVVRHGDPATVLTNLALEFDADGVTACADYSGLAEARDDRIETALDDVDVEFETVHDYVLHPPGSITTNAGDPYAVFSYYGEKWLTRAGEDAVDPPAADDLVSVQGDDLPTLAELSFPHPEADVPPAGIDVASERLETFCDGPIYRYAERRDYPARGGTSRLSPHLSFGTIGVRTVYQATEAARRAIEAEGAVDGAGDAVDDELARESVREFQEQLAWREFYVQVLADRPDTVRENFKQFENQIDWRQDTSDFRTWTAGRTGYPLVDAGMRQLRQEAWMHNRVRMVAAAFLTKHLLLDWRWGYRWFREKLVDHDTANDVGGWQWAASTGTDAQPYFRIFNPATQAADYDPDTDYITEYVPELADVEPSVIHDWPTLSPETRSTAAPAYPEPVVDHATARERALATFRRARGDED
ncbi:cryptochrome/photolyase family protein [Halobacteriales archaeon Cl-PHB]